MKTLSSLGSLLLTGGLTAAVLVQAPAHATHDHDRHHGGHGPSATRPHLDARATLDADSVQPGPPSGAQATPANGRTGPFPGQVIPGFSAVVERGDGTFWAQPDNGFGAKGNSADFLLRIYHVRPRWETARGGTGAIEVLEHVSLADPDHVLDFPIVNDGTADRLLTGADFDIESLVAGRDGTFWVGDEFGPFLLHFDRTGALLEKPVPFPGGKSPGNPYLAAGETPNVASSRGFEAMGGSPDGRYLYPVVEGALNDDADKRRRWVYQYDVRSGAYTGERWAYQTDQEGNLVGDAFMVEKRRLLLVERDDFDGPAAVTKRVYQVDLGRTDADGYLEKTLLLDALGIDNPDLIGDGSGYGTGEKWSLPVQSFETIVGLRDGRYLIANDNNYPGNSARNPGTPDDTEMAIISLRKVHAAGEHATVIGHRGASGYRPEHTLASYEQAILQCADFIEPDLVSTKDGVLVARHEPEIGGTTDVAQHPEFASRKTTRDLDGVQVTGWFTDDFTLAELRTLRAKERLPQVRPDNTRFDGRYLVPTFDEVLDLARHSRTCDGKPVGVYPETKHPTYFDQRGLSLEEPLLATLRANGLDRRGAPVFIQSFETSNLRELDRRTDLPLVQLVDCAGAPYDLKVMGDPTTYADLVTRRGLRGIASYADGLGACKDLLIPRKADGSLDRPTSVIRDAHRAGLLVHAYTFRREAQYTPAGTDVVTEIRTFLRAGLDGFFTDNPDLGRAAVLD
jgi:glycerophosphoryl diester phosphodiesterase